MIRQNFSMPSPISIKPRTNMTFIECHCFSPVNKLIDWMTRTQLSLFTSHNDVNSVWSLYRSLPAPRSGGGLWLRRWLSTHSTTCPGPPAMRQYQIIGEYFCYIWTWAALSQWPSLISELESITIFVSVWVFLFLCESLSVLQSYKSSSLREFPNDVHLFKSMYVNDKQVVSSV